MTHDQYLDEPDDVIEWALHISQARHDFPWQAQRERRG